MKALKQNIGVIAYAVLLVTAWLASVALTPRNLSPLVAEGFDLSEIIPTEFAGWKVDPRVRPVQPIESGSLAGKVYDQTISRGYRNAAGDLIMLVVAYGRDQSDTLQLHRPEICYSANGFKISNLREHRSILDERRQLAVPVLNLEAENFTHNEPVTYWTRVGDAIPSGNLGRQIHKIYYGLSGRIPDGILVRISSVSRDSEAAFKNHDAFIKRLMTAIPTKYWPLFLGSLATEFSEEALNQ